MVIYPFSGRDTEEVQESVVQALSDSAEVVVESSSTKFDAGKILEEQGASLVITASVVRDERMGGRLVLVAFWDREGLIETLPILLNPSGSIPRSGRKQLVQRYKELAPEAILKSREQPTKLPTSKDEDGSHGAVERMAIDPAQMKLQANAKTVKAFARTSKIVIDGRANEKAWQNAEEGKDFSNISPNHGAPASDPTTFKVLYDEDALYVFVHARQSPKTISAPLVRRDDVSRLGESDWLVVRIDSRFTRRNAFQFWVNPAGSVLDTMIINDSQFRANWNAFWTVETRRTKDGWTAEYRIPFSQLRLAGKEKWGFDLLRWNQGVRQEWTLGPRVNQLVSHFGNLVGVDSVTPKRPFFVQPYLIGQVDRVPQGNSFRKRSELAGNLGGGFGIGLTDTLNLTGAINPDFGAVDADPSVVNLSDREVFFPELRPLFADSDNLFGFSLSRENGFESLFYSRRVGSATSGSGSALSSDFEQEDVSRILGAAKLRGNVGKLNVAAFTGVTSQEKATYIDPADDMEREAIVEPLANYSTFQIGSDWDQGGKSWRLAGTSVLRQRPSETLALLHRRAFALGTSYRQRFKGPWEVNGRLVGSHVEGDAEAIARTQRSSQRYLHRVDADHLTYDPTRTSLTGFQGTASLTNEANRGVYGGFGVDARSPELETNDAGFLLDADLLTAWARIGYRDPVGGHSYRSFSTTLTAASILDTGFNHLRDEFRLEGSTENRIDAPVYLEAKGYIGLDRIALNRALLRGGPAVVGSNQFNAGISVETNRRKNLFLDLGFDGWAVPKELSWQGQVWMTANWRPLPELILRAGPVYTRKRDDRQWHAETADPMNNVNYILARLDRKSISATLRGSYLFSPRLSIDVYLQPFVNSDSFSQYKRLRQARAASYADRFEVFPDSTLIDVDGDYGYDGDGDGAPDFTFRRGDRRYLALRSNIVLRWEYRPYSFFTLAWSQGLGEGTPAPSSGLFSDLGRSFLAPGEHVVLAKINAWFGR